MRTPWCTAQDRDGVRDGGLVHHDWLETPFEGGVLLDVSPVLVERRRADAVQFAPRQQRLEHVARVHGAFRSAGADDVVQLVDEQQDAALGGLHLLQDGLQALLELAAVLRAREEHAHVEGEDRPVAEALRHVAVHDALCEPLDDRRLAHAGVADQHRVVLRLAGQDLDDAADLAVATDHRVEPAAARLRDEVPSVPLERLVRRLGRLARDTLAPAHLGQDLQQALAGEAAVVQDAVGRGLQVGAEHREHEVLHRHVVILEALGLLLRDVEQPGQRARHADIGGGTRAGDRRPRPEVLPERVHHRADVDVGAGEQPRHEPIRLLQQCQQHVLDVDLETPGAERHLLGGRERLLALLGQAVRVHGVTSCAQVGVRSEPAVPPARRCVRGGRTREWPRRSSGPGRAAGAPPARGATRRRAGRAVPTGCPRSARPAPAARGGRRGRGGAPPREPGPPSGPVAATGRAPLGARRSAAES
jgi:hypothetical protein